MKTKIIKTKRNREQMITFLNEEITRMEGIKLKCVAKIQNMRDHIISLEEKIKASKARQEIIEKKKADKKSLRKAICYSSLLSSFSFLIACLSRCLYSSFIT